MTLANSRQIDHHRRPLREQRRNEQLLVRRRLLRGDLKCLGHGQPPSDQFGFTVAARLRGSIGQMTHFRRRSAESAVVGSADDEDMEHAEQLIEAQELVAAGRWEQARQRLAGLLAVQESPEAHDGMGTALWWLCRVRESLDHRERAYAGYLAEHRHVEAAIVALDISVCHLSNLDNPVAAQGWIARARRIGGARRRRPARRMAVVDGGRTPARSRHANGPCSPRRCSGRAAIDDLDLELAALSDLGLALVIQGEVPDGLRLVDEAMAGTLGGECRRLDTVVWASCSMLAACSLVGDHRRAAQWCGVADRFAEKYGCPFLQARCRSHYGRVLVALGDWDQAEIELNQALAMSADCGREPRVEALAGLAELRLRQGAVDEAAAMLSEVGDLPSAVVVTAEVLTAQGHPDRAVAVLRARLTALDGHESEFPVVAAGLVDAYLAHGDVAMAAAAAQHLRRATPEQHPQTTALVHRADGLVAASSGDAELAERRLRAAVTEFDRLDLPFQARHARVRTGPGRRRDQPLAWRSSRRTGPWTGWSGSVRFAKPPRRRRSCGSWGSRPSRGPGSTGC